MINLLPVFQYRAEQKKLIEEGSIDKANMPQPENTKFYNDHLQLIEKNSKGQQDVIN